MSNFNINQSLGYLISKTNSLMRNEFNRMIKEKGYNATVEQWGVLSIINKKPGIIQSEIAALGIKDKTNITRMLDVLEKNGNVERKPSKKDRRLYNIYITEQGKELLDNLTPIAIEVNKFSATELSLEELETLTNLLEKVYKKLKK